MKKALALAIAAAVVAPMAAAADVVVYGKAHVSVDKVDAKGGADNYQVRSRASRLGFKGSEDLGNGLKAIFQYEVSYGLDGPGQDTGPTGFGAARNSYVGLAGGWGTFLVGRHDTPTKVAYYAAGFEEISDSILDLNSGPGFVAADIDDSGDVSLGWNGAIFQEFRANNAIAYISPSFGGFTLAGAVVPGENGAPCKTDDCDSFADHYSVSAMYAGGGLKASIGYEVKNLADVPNALNELADEDFGIDLGLRSDDEAILQVGASYSFGAFKVGAMYQDISNYGSIKDVDYDAWGLNLAYKLGNTKLVGQYATGELDDAGDLENWGLGAEHMFSKRTSAYVAYNNYEWDEADIDADQFSIGMVHKF